MPAQPYDLWYGDLTRYGSDDGEPIDAPKRNVQQVTFVPAEGDEEREELNDKSFYLHFLSSGEWMPADDERSVIERLLEYPGDPFILFSGLYVLRRQFEEVRYTARHDRRLPGASMNREEALAYLQEAADGTSYTQLMDRIAELLEMKYSLTDDIDPIAREALGRLATGA